MLFELISWNLGVRLTTVISRVSIRLSFAKRSYIHVVTSWISDVSAVSGYTVLSWWYVLVFPGLNDFKIMKLRHNKIAFICTLAFEHKCVGGTVSL